MMGTKTMISSFAVRLLAILLAYGLGNLSNAACNNKCSKCDTGYCAKCYYGYWGYNCHLQCVNCWLAGCDKISGRCIQCEPGLQGVHCDKSCPSNCRPSRYEDIVNCNRHTGKCLEGCKDGWWGAQCQHDCSTGCQKACFQDDGACISDCSTGLYGRHCNMACSAGCSEGTCDWLTGNCQGGCIRGYKGDKCEEDICSINCNTPCTMIKETTAAESRGLVCVEGCRSGFFGEQCLQKCHRKCRSCDRLNGTYCTSCHKGQTGNHCENITGKITVLEVEEYAELGEEMVEESREVANNVANPIHNRDASPDRISILLIIVTSWII